MRPKFLLVLGILLVALGAFVALRPLWAGLHPITGAIWLDMTFAFVFLVRGYMNIRSARRLWRATPDAAR